MTILNINQSIITKEIAGELAEACPFGAITFESNMLLISSACKMCKLCTNHESKAVTVAEVENEKLDKSQWTGICVLCDFSEGALHPVALELLGKAKQLADVIGHPVYALVIGHNTKPAQNQLLHYGADKVFVYDNEVFEHFKIEPYTNACEDFINKIKPSSILAGATNIGRSLAPRVAARFKTGLTADCTVLEMDENTDLLQIRPAFGGNIMAKIITPNNRPQFCTVRYKIFEKPEYISHPQGEVVNMQLPEEKLQSAIEIIDVTTKQKEIDISDAEMIIAVGRGVKKQEDLKIINELADKLDAQVACTRPLIENGWFDAKKQIGLSGRTVKPKLIITLGISGSIQFVAGMRSSDCIIAINTDENASIFDVAHYCVVGDWYKILPDLISKIKAGDM